MERDIRKYINKNLVIERDLRTSDSGIQYYWGDIVINNNVLWSTCSCDYTSNEDIKNNFINTLTQEVKINSDGGFKMICEIDRIMLMEKYKKIKGEN